MFSRKNVIAVVAVLVLIPLAAVAWWLGSPLLMNTTVEEEFPFAFAATVPPDMTMAGVEQVMAGMAKVDQEVNEPMPDVIGDAVPEAMIDAMMDAVPQTVVDAMSPGIDRSDAWRHDGGDEKGDGAGYPRGHEGCFVQRNERRDGADHARCDERR